MTESAKPEHPASVVIELGDQQVVFVRVGDDRYAAELEGKRRLIRTVQQLSEVSESGRYVLCEPTRSEGDTANIDTILRCLALGAAYTPLARGVKLSVTDAWGHFRQNTFLKVSITIAEDGAVEIDEDIGEEDGSYY